jgi:hypothetical protein
LDQLPSILGVCPLAEPTSSVVSGMLIQAAMKF